MGLCCSFLKTVLHLPQNQSTQRSIEIARKIDDATVPKETQVAESSSNQNAAITLDQNKKKEEIDRNCINLIPIPTSTSAYHKSTGRSLNLENDKVSQEKDKIDNTKKSNTISLIDKDSNFDSPQEKNKESETTIKIRKDELVMPADLMEKINKIINKKEVNHPHANLSNNDKEKSLSLGDVVSKDQNPVEELKEEKEPLFEEKKSVSPKLNTHVAKDGDVKHKKGKETLNNIKQLPSQNQAENQNVHVHDNNIKKLDNPHQNGRTTESTIKTSDKNILINLKEIEIMTEKAGGNDSPADRSPKKSLLKYKTIGDERKKSLVKKNVKFKGVPNVGNSKKQRGSSQNQKSPIK